MTIDDAEHYTPEEREAIVAAYPAHEREARAKGIPVLGAGRIFPIPEEDITCDPIAIPPHWKQIGGMDFGWDHPFAAVGLAHDPDADIVYVTKVFRQTHVSPIIGSAALKPWGDWLPWSWPRDGRRETQEGAGEALAKQFRTQGLQMLPLHAQFEDGSVSVEAGLMEMLDRMQTRRWLVFRHLSEWFEEYRLYHRAAPTPTAPPRVVKERDDLMAASRYGYMMLRFAKASPKHGPQPRRGGRGDGGWMG